MWARVQYDRWNDEVAAACQQKTPSTPAGLSEINLKEAKEGKRRQSVENKENERQERDDQPKLKNPSNTIY